MFLMYYSSRFINVFQAYENEFDLYNTDLYYKIYIK